MSRVQNDKYGNQARRLHWILNSNAALLCRAPTSPKSPAKTNSPRPGIKCDHQRHWSAIPAICLVSQENHLRAKAKRPEALWQALVWQKITREMTVMCHIASQVSSTIFISTNPVLSEIWSIHQTPTPNPLSTSLSSLLHAEPFGRLTDSQRYALEPATACASLSKGYDWTGINLGERLTLAWACDILRG